MKEENGVDVDQRTVELERRGSWVSRSREDRLYPLLGHHFRWRCWGLSYLFAYCDGVSSVGCRISMLSSNITTMKSVSR